MRSARRRRCHLRATGRYLLVHGEVRQRPTTDDLFEIEIRRGPPGASLDLWVDGRHAGTVTLDLDGCGWAWFTVGESPAPLTVSVRHGRRAVVGGSLPAPAEVSAADLQPVPA